MAAILKPREIAFLRHKFRNNPNIGEVKSPYLLEQRLLTAAISHYRQNGTGPRKVYFWFGSNVYDAFSERGVVNGDKPWLLSVLKRLKEESIFHEIISNMPQQQEEILRSNQLVRFVNLDIDPDKISSFRVKIFNRLTHLQQSTVLRSGLLPVEDKLDLIYQGGSCNKKTLITNEFKLLREAPVKPVNGNIYGRIVTPAYGNSRRARSQFLKILTKISILNSDARFRGKLIQLKAKVIASSASSSYVNLLMTDCKKMFESLYHNDRASLTSNGVDKIIDLSFEHCLAGCITNIEMFYYRVAYSGNAGLNLFLSVNKREIFRRLASAFLTEKKGEPQRRGWLLFDIDWRRNVDYEVHDITTLLNFVHQDFGLEFKEDIYSRSWEDSAGTIRAGNQRLKRSFMEYISSNIEGTMVSLIAGELDLSFTENFGRIDSEIKKLFAKSEDDHESLQPWIN